MIAAVAGPKYEITGNRAGFNAWRTITARCGSPCARAVRMKSARSTSIILPRVSRAMYAICGSPSAMTGNTRWRQSPKPPAGSHFSVTANNSTKSGAMTKFGIETPVIAAAITAWSVNAFCLSAAIVPTATPTQNASSIARPPKRSDTGKPAAINSVTV